MFRKVLIANRGEIAVRVTRTLRKLGIPSVAVYSDADAGARHVREAGEAVRIGPPPAAGSYLNIGAVIGAATAAGADAVHPGYGFLAENAAFARACAAAGLTFIGPPPGAIEAMGDKIAAKARVSAAGVPVVPGAGSPGMSDEELIGQLNGLWFPVLVKPSAGGGGKGMHVARAPGDLPGALAAARREARAAFGDDTLLIEQYVARPRHVEIQVLADTHGTVIHLGERECSLQRRHQKIIEEAPSPLLDEARREAMGAAAVEAARSVGYTGAGTVEFIVSGDDPDRFYFMEMNTRLQVEHPVTELVYNLDLVEWQLRAAAGERLPARPARHGHAIEARVYAEDPARGFLPTGGRVLALREPDGPGIRVDSGLAEGSTVTSAYDPMLAKVIAWGPDRAAALRLLDSALAGTAVLGVTTNIAFLRSLLHDPDVRSGRLDTGLAERLIEAGAGQEHVPDEVLAAAALSRLLAAERAGTQRGGTERNGVSRPGNGADPWDIPDGWRIGEPAWTRFRFGVAGTVTEVRVRGLASQGAEVAVGEGVPLPARAQSDDAGLLVSYAGRTVRFTCASDGGTVWLGRDGQAWALAEETTAPARRGQGASADTTVRSPMPGTVIAVLVSAGQAVAAGQPLLVVEAMKMEHTVTAPAGGVVAELTVKAGQPVGMDDTLAVIGPEPGDGG
ncbi:MAG TPA: biotin carboxylase N-terminal domain-containing protein [Trebonia sp.]|nr:biotin carboxylase N-terminal domain-containing protein [Trebonia sp.]